MTRSIHLIACFLVLFGLVAVNCSPIDSSTLQSRVEGTAVVGYMYVAKEQAGIEAMLKDDPKPKEGEPPRKPKPASFPMNTVTMDHNIFSPAIYATPHYSTVEKKHQEHVDPMSYVIIVRAPSLQVFSHPDIKRLYVPTEKMPMATQAIFEEYEKGYDYKKTAVFSYNTKLGIILSVSPELQKELGLTFTAMRFATFQALPKHSTPTVDWSFLKDNVKEWPAHLSLEASGVKQLTTGA